MSIITPTERRVSDHTAPEVNRRIQRQTKARIDLLADEGPAAIECRLNERVRLKALLGR